MSFINYSSREINCKIVYYGPGRGGKTTNLEYVHSKLDPSLTGELVTLKTKEDRTIFFDFMQIEVGRIKGKKPKFNLYTVPGQVYYASSRKIILNGVDGIVFVADSQRDRMEGNIETLLDLENNLLASGFSLETFPWVIQYNKRDLKDIVPAEELNDELNHYSVPIFEAVATEGVGVQETLEGIANLRLGLEDRIDARTGPAVIHKALKLAHVRKTPVVAPGRLEIFGVRQRLLPGVAHPAVVLHPHQAGGLIGDGAIAVVGKSKSRPYCAFLKLSILTAIVARDSIA